MFVVAFYRRSQGWTLLFRKTWTERPIQIRCSIFPSNGKKDSPSVPFSGRLWKILKLPAPIRTIFASLLEVSTFQLSVPKKDVTLVLPYLGLHSDVITRRLKSCVNKFYGFVNLRVVFQNTRRIKSFFPYKDRSTGRRNRRLSTKPVARIVMLFTSAKLKEDYMTERLSTSKLSLKLVTPPLLLSIRFPLVTTSNGTILRS